MRITHPIVRLARMASNRLAMSDASRRLTYGDLDRLIRRAAVHLRSVGGERGARVAVSARNSLAWVVVAHACARLGAILVPVHLRSSRVERERTMATLTPTIWLTDEAISDRGALPSGVYCATFSKVALEWDAVADEDARGIPEAIELDDINAVIATSGSTGVPKYVCLTNRNLYFSALASSINLGHRADDSWLINLPLSHVGGLSILHRAAVSGFSVIVQEGFDAEGTWRAIVENGVTHLSLVPTTLSRLLDMAGSTPFPEQVRAVLVGGGPSSPELLQRARDLGVPVLPTYGLTEASSQVVTLPPGLELNESEVAGRPLPFAEVDIRTENGEGLEIGESGAIWIRGPMVARAYWTADGLVSALSESGWLATNDVGFLDASGLLHVAGRSDDVIVSGGENISLLEIEHTLIDCPGVACAAVIAVDDDEWGQTPVAFVTSTVASSVRADQLTTALQKRLVRYKVPKRIIVLEQMPETTIGKVDRRALRTMINGGSK